mmetsp:Transcript_30638/g.59768  ORF Transcript_30638/g.59768 Transcript_30638/m.59768 type:complete len:1142 (+) Transcript_30638:56-3481(+)
MRLVTLLVLFAGLSTAHQAVKGRTHGLHHLHHHHHHHHLHKAKIHKAKKTEHHHSKLVHHPSKPHILKSIRDVRDYRYIKLDNGLEAVLIHQPMTPKAAVSMNIGSGSWHDPSNIPGLSHFLEHMLFLGNKKYPVENNFQKWLDSHGGNANAYTGTENTNFYFECQSTSLLEGLERWSQFFVSPLFSVDSAEREMHAVDSEHGKNLQSDGWHNQRLFGILAQPQCPMGKFGTGNLATLSSHSPKVMQQKLFELFHKYYVASNMQLAILGSQSLDDLEKVVRQNFKDLSTKPVHKDPKPPCTWKTSYSPKTLGSKVYLRTKAQGNSMTLHFVLPPTRKLYKEHPGGYLSAIMGSHCKNSMNTILRNKGWTIGSTGSAGNPNSIFSEFSWTFVLTEKGKKHEDDIIRLFFDYLTLIKEHGVSQWRYNEMSELANLHFAFKPLDNPMNFVSDISAKLKFQPIKDLIIADSLFLKYDKKVFKDYIGHITPDNMLVFIESPHLHESMPKKEQYYGFHYGVEKISSKLLKTYLKPSRLSRKMQLSGKLTTMPKNLAVFAKMRTVVPLAKQAPQVIWERESPAARLWFHHDEFYLEPYATSNFKLWSTVPFSDARSDVLASMYTLLFDDHMVSYLDGMKNVGYSYSISKGALGLGISLNGFSSPKAFTKFNVMVMGKLNSPEIFHTTRFEELKKLYREGLFNSQKGQPYKIASGLFSSLLLPRVGFHPRTLAKTLDSVTLQEVKEWAKEQLFSDTQLEGFVYGNMKRHHAKHLMKRVIKAFHYETDSPSFANPEHRTNTLPRPRAVRLPPLTKYSVHSKHPSPKQTNACVLSYRQYGNQPGRDVATSIYMQLLSATLQKTIYNELRTKEQLGYIVWSYPVLKQEVYGFVIQVQSSVYNATYLDQRVEAVIPLMEKHIEKLSDAEFKQLLSSVAAKFAQPIQGHQQQISLFWGKIIGQDYRFDLNKRHVEMIESGTITKQGLKNMFQALYRTKYEEGSGGGGAISILLDPQVPVAKAHAPAKAVPSKKKPSLTASTPLSAAKHQKKVHAKPVPISKFLEEASDIDFFADADDDQATSEVNSVEEESMLEDHKTKHVLPKDMEVSVTVTAIGVPGTVAKLSMTTTTLNALTDTLPLFGTVIGDTVPPVTA